MNRSGGRFQTKNDPPEDPHESPKMTTRLSPGLEIPRPTHGGGVSRASGGRATRVTQPGLAQKGNVDLSRGLTTCEAKGERQVQWQQVRRTMTKCPSAMETGSRDVERHFIGGKGARVVEQVERYQIDIVSLTSSHSTGSGNKRLDPG